MSEVPHPSKDILVVDDDAIMRDLICDWLEAAGYAVRRADNCHAAAAQLEAGAPALVVSDMWMPGPRGAEAIGRFRQMYPQVAVIAVSGHFGSGQGCSKREAMQAGAARTLAKPLKRSELVSAVAELIGPPPK